jgi:hypothetical protein
MPLFQGKSKKAFSKNVETEMDAGKPQKQSLAIAYAVQKKNKKKTKMAEGGQVPAPKNSPAPDLHEAADKAMKDVTDGIESRMKAKQAQGKPGYAKGGMASADMDRHATSIADAIMEKRHKMAQGGMVDLEANSEEEGSSPYDT